LPNHLGTGKFKAYYAGISHSVAPAFVLAEMTGVGLVSINFKRIEKKGS
jgi:hypothetical protein